MVAWQLAFLLLGTGWLWAPYLNSNLSYRTSLISQYETLAQPYSWLFRITDLLAGILLLLVAYGLLRRPSNKIVSWTLFITAIGLCLDPILATTCHSVGVSCTEYVSLSFVLHAVETIITAAAIFGLTVYDAWLRKKIVSIFYVLLQIGYGVLFVSQLANHDHFNTVSQFVYQTSIIVWLAWFYRDFVVGVSFKTQPVELKIAKQLAAAWAFLNGILAILISLAHIHLLGKIKGLYFVGDSAWLAQHGVIIGVVLIYISRHLARGELRARQIFLVISGIETLKYSVVSPNPSLMLLYLVTFCGLFVLRDDFSRGVVPITWRIRLRDLYFMVGGLLVAVLMALLALDRDNKASVIAARSLDNFFDYVTRSDITSHSHLRSALLAHTISVFLVGSIASVLWILFKPYKPLRSSGRNYFRVEQLLQRFSESSEDYFKLWPADKDYFWQVDGAGFVAYKSVGSVVFALADPISNNRVATLDNFIVWTKSRRLKPCFLPVYEQNLEMYLAAGFQSLQIGSSALINIDEFLTGTVNDKWWRWQRNRAEKGGYKYERSLPPHSHKFIRQLKTVSDAWLTKAGRSEHGFALGHFDENYLQKSIIHYLKDESGNVLAFTNQLPQFNLSEIITVDLLRHLPDVNNAMPYLLYRTIQALADETKAYKTFDLGFVPFAKAKGPILTIAKTLSGERFSSKGVEQFKSKFKPAWQPNYLVYESKLADLALIALNLEKAMEYGED